MDDADTESILTMLLELGINTFVCLQAEVNIHIPEHAWRAGHGLRPYIKARPCIVPTTHASHPPPSSRPPNGASSKRNPPPPAPRPHHAISSPPPRPRRRRLQDAQRILSRAHDTANPRITQQKIDFLHLPIIDGNVTTDSAMNRQVGRLQLPPGLSRAFVRGRVGDCGGCNTCGCPGRVQPRPCPWPSNKGGGGGRVKRALSNPTAPHPP